MRVDDYWSQMADEIATEVQQGRMAGPFTAPHWWPIPAVPLRTHDHTRTLLPLPLDDPIIAVAFISASTRQALTVNPRSAGEKIGDGVDTTKPVR